MMTEFLRKEESGAAGNGRRSTVGAETTLKRTGAVKIQKSSNLTILTAILALVVVFGACKKDDMDVNSVNAIGKTAISKVVWNGASDRDVAVNIVEVKNTTRKNASGTKITSNAHSADFPGIYFIWDSKQKDNGYLKVAAEVFEKYEGFTLTSKESNTYWDFNIQVQPGQQKTADNCYVFYIPKVYNNKNINMVFIGGFLESDVPVINEPPIFFSGPCGEVTYLIISGAADNKNEYLVDPTNSWTKINGQPIRNVWSSAISGAYPTDWANMMGIQTANGIGPRWVWERGDSWETGVSGSNLVLYVTEFELEGLVNENEIPFYFACDNAAVVFVNGVAVANTTHAFAGRNPAPTTELGFTDFSDNAFNGELWQHLYKVDILEHLQLGANRIVVVAANSDENNGRWNIDNNPAGLIYGCKFTVGTPCEE